MGHMADKYHTILVTGGAGFIGSHLVDLLVEHGHKVVVLDALTYAGSKDNLAQSWDKITFIEGSICDAELVHDLCKTYRFDAVINTAAESHVDNSIAAPDDFMETNIIGTYVMLQAVRTHCPEARFVQMSTDEVFGTLGEKFKFTETTPYDPRSPYSSSKAAADHLVMAWYHTYGMDAVITHCTNNYGPRQYPEKLIPVIIKRALAGEELPVYGDGENVRDWIYVHDHVRGVYAALMCGTAGEHYSFGGGNEISNNHMVATLCAILDRTRPHAKGTHYIDQKTFVTDRLGHDRRYAIDGAKAKKDLGYVPEAVFETALEDTVAWYLHDAQEQAA